ncbi:uncharacterized protein LOC132756272 [Ruditapes philippinarum]|uniref:uncharacterized protein LOC132756272 n=1 Tax=Ruditapes philippinarum TaxID=129788 RepID=UPI00295B27E6|nr:uncharacterized protein LOC132756272 [Ruditapes philippinarum]
MALWVLLALVSLSCKIEGSFKKGTCAYPGNLLCDDFKVLNNMSWWYDWSMDLSFYYDKVGQHCNGTNRLVPKHVPMVKKYNNHTNLTIQTWGKFVLGFNEPDREAHGNMTPQQAADAWPEIEKNSHGAKLVSPAAGGKFKWYEEFFRLCNGCRIDFLAAHMYNCDANAIMSYLQQLFHRYNKKIWLTEFACPQTHDEKKQLHLMKTLLPQLEAADYVFRYSWFSARIPQKRYDSYVTPSASLLQPNSSELTMIGQFYNSFHVQHDYSHMIG